MNIITSFLKKNPCYIANDEFTPKGIMVSMVGCPQPSAKVFINNWNRESCDKVCPHILIDANDGEVYQTLPYCVRGRYSKAEEDTDYNDYIQVFLCEPSQIKYQKGETFTLVGDKERALQAVERAYSSAVEVCVYLCHMFGFDTMQIIYPDFERSHEGSTGNPKEPNAFWRQLCEEGVAPHMMSMLRCEVEDCYTKPPVTTGQSATVGEPSDPASVTIGMDLASGPDYSVVNGEVIPNPNVAVGPINSAIVHTEEEEQAKDEVFNYPSNLRVQIDIPNLRIRKGPGTGAGCEPIGKYAPTGLCEITEIQNGSGSEKGWAKLASGEGWISMDYAKVL